ncbi:sialate O-acetylesterase [Flavobacterium resistens]|uniref:Sialate O-acetylesterase n=1 Tax=Flavobacterium resistens TaxID=443612 RepID=A0A521DMG7_9FLAO|nr:sialate O-acetylesterase [Flavobacterium resistens]MRX68341.1 sialate O-acetylesterase [Flavobacterium resistens]SMO72795.1 sialate O-acetylesterase [Flavobacterium resistens]
MRKVLILISVLICGTIYSQIKLPRLISDGMILQRDIPVKIWGWAAPNEKIEITFNKKKFQTTTSQDGNWILTLPSQKAGGPYEMTLTASNTIVVKNILFGDVWLCSGQSNMELPMERVKDKYSGVISKINNSEIRQFLVPDQYDFSKENTDLSSGEWKEANASNILSFSAVAYFFASEIYAKYKVPIGLINSALGGSPAESWLSADAIKKFPDYDAEYQKFKDGTLGAQIEANDKKVSADWYSEVNRQDEGLKKQWSKADFDDIDWPVMNIPGYWTDYALEKTNGAVWFRKEVNLSNLKASSAKLILGRIVDADSVYVNGNFVGTTSYLYPPRKYSFDPKLLKEGKNEIAIRVINNSGKGGFVEDKPYQLVLDKDSIDLKGEWKYKLGVKMAPLPPPTFIRWKPVGLYNSMIAPLKNYAIKGVLWYQGESSTKKPQEYGALMETLITSWRKEWKQGDFPFLYVQLTNFMEPKTEPSESNWAALRQQQKNTLAVPNTGMAVTIDLGEWNDIHPLNKYDVGKRLSLQARKVAYGEKNIVSSGPLFKSMEQKGNQLILSFSDTGSGLIAKNNSSLKGFEIAGSDGKFVWANAKIEGNKIKIWNENISKPVKVRYAWADNPIEANLYNKENLPASPFEGSLDK